MKTCFEKFETEMKIFKCLINNSYYLIQMQISSSSGIYGVDESPAFEKARVRSKILEF